MRVKLERAQSYKSVPTRFDKAWKNCRLCALVLFCLFGLLHLFVFCFWSLFSFVLCIIVSRHIRLVLTHWSRVTHICVSKLPTIGSDNGLSPGRRQAIIWTYAGILLIGPLWINFSEILIKIPTFSFKKMRLKVSSAKWRPCCIGLNVLILFLVCMWNRWLH